MPIRTTSLQLLFFSIISWHNRLIVLETDSPYLAPSPYRGKRNESSYLSIIAEKLSEIYNLDVSEISRITQKNSYEIFGD